jgi:hypothetical protein
MSCGTNSGWRMAVEVNAATGAWLHLDSTNQGGTLDLRASLPLTNGLWTKVDLTFNGGIATFYANGRQLQSKNGAIRGSRAPLIIGASMGGLGFDGVLDDLKVYSRERGAAEIGPIAQTMWETVLRNGSTNLVLQGFGPQGKPLTYMVVPIINPTNGSVSHAGDGPVVSYAAGGQKGPDAFTYTVSDGEFTSPPAIVTMSIVEPHWLSPSGGAENPRDGSSPARAWPSGNADAVDAVWRTNRFYDCFFYAPGTYETRGYKWIERGTAFPGCKHIGSGRKGAQQTTLKLVDIISVQAEEVIFAIPHNQATCDGFEVRNMVLDCNATNLPKFLVGEPAQIRIPLVTTGVVESVRLRWQDRGLYGNSYWRIGEAQRFSVTALRSGTNLFVTNCTSLLTTGGVTQVAMGVAADELLVQLDARKPEMDFYGLQEIEIQGTLPSLPTSKTFGSTSQLDAQHSILWAVDGNFGTSWASGTQSEAQVTIPLGSNSAVNLVKLSWNCQSLTGVGRLGAAMAVFIRARDQSTGLWFDVPAVAHSRTAFGDQVISFGSINFTNVIFTDQLSMVLSNREPGVDFYSLKEISLQNDLLPVSMRLPSATGTLAWGENFHIFRAFDQNSSSDWVAGQQGMVGAIEVAGNNMKFTELDIVGFGTKATRECFVLSLEAYGPVFRDYGNVLVEDCNFSNPAPANTDGLTVLSMMPLSPSTLTNATVRRCRISGVRSHFVYSQGATVPLIEDCVVEDCLRAFYMEPEPGRNTGPAIIRSNRFENVYQGVYISTHPAAQVDSITCIGNEIVLSGWAASGVSVCDLCRTGPSGSVTNFTALDNIVRYSGWTPQPAGVEGGLLYSDLRHAVFGNNVVALGVSGALRQRQCPAGTIYPPGGSEDCDHPGLPPPVTPYSAPCLDQLLPGYRRAWFNNRDLNGALLNVRFNNNGVDGMASQQQWPD